MVPGMTVEKTIRVRINKAIDYTSLWYTYAPKEYIYYSIESVSDRLQVENGSGDLIRLNFIIDAKYKLTERKVYTVYDMLGQVGGFMGIVFPFGAIITSMFSNKIYIMTLMSYYFKVDEYETEDRPATDHKIMQTNQIEPIKKEGLSQISKTQISKENEKDEENIEEKKNPDLGNKANIFLDFRDKLLSK